MGCCQVKKHCAESLRETHTGTEVHRGWRMAALEGGRADGPHGALGLFPQAATVQANAELREALLATQRRLREAEARQDETRAQLLRAERQGGEGAASRELVELRRRLDAAEQELHAKDRHIAAVERLCVEIGNEHERAMADTRGVLDGLDSDRRIVADQRDEIRRLQSKLVQLPHAGDPRSAAAAAAHVDAATLVSRSAKERLELANKQMERNLLILQGDNKAKAEQVKALTEQLELNRRTMAEQNAEISRLTESVRRLRDEKQLAASGAPGHAPGDQGRAFVMMRERVSEAEVRFPPGPERCLRFPTPCIPSPRGTAHVLVAGRGILIDARRFTWCAVENITTGRRAHASKNAGGKYMRRRCRQAARDDHELDGAECAP